MTVLDDAKQVGFVGVSGAWVCAFTRSGPSADAGCRPFAVMGLSWTRLAP